jgi:hypothetical protein
MANPFLSVDPQDAKALAQRTRTVPPAGPVPVPNPWNTPGIPLPGLDIKTAAVLIGPQS